MNPERKKLLLKDDDKVVEELAETIVESLRGDYQSDLEPFEAYAQKVRAHVYQSIKEYRERFANGYEVLLREIEKEKKG